MVSEPSKNNKEEGLVVAGCKGQPAAAKAPCKAADGHDQPPCRGGRLQPRPPYKGAAGHPQGTIAGGQPTRGCPRRTRKGLPPTGATMLAAGVAATRSAVA
ncbi:hypothetical protein GW17_00042849 [Ensete ventricosum]|nr:hypothetical protein GW17_00042849 [Ensete ventricosum]